jgi:hypothetical protein
MLLCSMMLQKQQSALSRRERQIMDLLYQRGRATAADIHTAIADAPTYSAIHAKLRVLEEKGDIRHEADGPRSAFRMGFIAWERPPRTRKSPCSPWNASSRSR